MHQSSRAWWESLGTALIVASIFVVATPVSSVLPERTGGSSFDGPAPLIHCARDPSLCEPPIGWGSPVALDPDFHYMDNPVLAVDSGGNALALWSQIDGTRSKVWASRYIVNWGWSIPTSLDEQISDGGSGAQIAMDANGNAIAVWSQSEGAHSRVMANRFTPTDEWDSATSVQSNDSALGHSPRIAVDPGGNATAVWLQSDGTGHFPVWSSRYTAGSGWNLAALIMPGETDATNPQVVMDPRGNAIAVWMQYIRVTELETRPNIWANRYTVGTGWGVARQLQASSEEAYNPRVAVDKSGNAFAVWYEREGDKYSVWANRFLLGTGWGTAAVIETGFSDASGPEVAVDSGGNAIAVWTQQDGGPGTQGSIWWNRFTFGSGWGSAMPVENSENAAGLPRVVIDESGNGIAAWTEWVGGRSSIAAARQTVGGDWAPSVAIGGGDQTDATLAGMAIDAGGNVLVVWRHFEGAPGSQGIESVGTNRYTSSGGWGTPTLLLGRHLHTAHSPDVATNARGNTVVAWVNRDDEQSRVVAGAFTNPVWGFQTEVVSNKTVGAGNVRLAIDGIGNAIAVWTEQDGYRYSVWSNRYILGSGWGAAMLIDSIEPFNIGPPLVASDLEGNAVVAWTSWAGEGNQLWAKRYAARDGWGPSTILSSGQGHVSEGTLGLTGDDAGNMIVAWVQRDDLGGTRVYANRYVIGSGWGTPTPISGQTGVPWISLSIDSNGDGPAVVAWDQFVDPGRFEIWGNRYGIATGWEGATLITNPSSSQPSGLRVSVDAHGNAFVVGGSDSLSDLGSSLFASRYTVGSGWSDAMPIRTIGQRYGLAASDIEMDADGDILVVWSEFDGIRTGVWASRYVTDWGWATPAPVPSSSEISDSGGANLAVAESGNSTVVWSEWDGTRSRVWMNTFVPDSTPLALLLTSPAKGAVVETPAVEVTGSTEPGAIVFINDLPAAVGIDGSFSATIALYPGPNVITAKAIDVRWSTAQLSTVVTYTTLPASLLVLLVTQAALAASTVVLFVLYWSARRPPGGTHKLSETPMRSDPARTEPAETPRAPPRALAPWNGWASARAPLRLTAKERILLHLLSYTKFADATEVPPDLAQGGIAALAAVDSRHFAQYIRPLVRAGLVRERTAHVKGNLHRRKVYGLTETGRKTAMGIRERLRPVVVHVQDSSGTRDATIAEVLAETTGSLSILEIVRQSLQSGIIELHR